MNAELKFFTEHPIFTIKYISKYYPFTYTELKKYQGFLNWQAVSSNENIKFTDKLLNDFKKRWWFYELLQNPKVKWDLKRIRNFEKNIFINTDDIFFGYNNIDEFDYEDGSIPIPERDISYRLATKKEFPWNLSLLQKNVTKIDWIQLSSNPEIKWSIEIIKKLKSKFDYELMSLKWRYWNYNTLKYFNDQYPKLINWSDLSKNESMNWTTRILDSFSHLLDFKSLSFNKKLPWDTTLIEKYEDLWDWDKLSENESINWTKELLIKYKNRLDKNFFMIQSIVLDTSLLKKYKNEVDWIALSANRKLEWSFSLVRSFEEFWDWTYLSRNSSIYWTEEMLFSYKDKIDWGYILDYGNFKLTNNGLNKLTVYLFPDRDFIETHILNCKKLPWTINLIEQVEKYMILYNPWFDNKLEEFGKELGFRNRFINLDLNKLKELCITNDSLKPFEKSSEFIYDDIISGNFYLARKRIEKLISKIENNATDAIKEVAGILRQLIYYIRLLQEYYSEWKKLKLPMDFNMLNSEERSTYCKDNSLNQREIELDFIENNKDLFKDLFSITLITSREDHLSDEYILDFKKWKNNFQRFITKSSLYQLLASLNSEAHQLGLLNSEKQFETDQKAWYNNYGKYDDDSDQPSINFEKRELADLLGYDETDVDDISIDDIKNRTGH